MKLGLIVPKIVFEPDIHTETAKKVYGRFFSKYNIVFGAFGAAFPLLAALTPDDFDVTIVDENHEELNYDEDFDLVGISSMTQQADRAYQIADQFRDRGVHVVLGGLHATVLPQEAKRHADTVIVGEAENTWPQFIRDFLSGTPAPFYRETGTVDLKRSPFPRYDLLNMEYYKLFYIEASRGCTRNCDFCGSARMYRPGIRMKTIEQVVEEIEFAKRAMKIPIIVFTDDNTFLDRAFGKALVKATIPLNIRWTCSSDISIAEDNELLELLAESGCFSLFIGFEGVDEGLGTISRWKRRQIQKYPEYIEKIQSKGIGIFGTFITGLDTHDPSIFDRIETFRRENHLYSGYVHVLTPLPGTRLWARLKREGRLLKRPWNRYNLWQVTFKPKLMSPEELQERQVELAYTFLFGDEKERLRYFAPIYRNLQREAGGRHRA